MTLSSFLSPSITEPVGPGQIPAPNIDRTEWAWNGGGGGWKGGKGNPNAALSALTLLAFLFFLNILQSCLKDSLNQTPGVVVMMMPTPTSATVRNKRELHSSEGGEGAHNWNAQIIDLVHNQVESYWSNKEAKSRKFQQNIKQKTALNTIKGEIGLSLSNKIISTKLNVTKITRNLEKDIHTKDTSDCTKSNERVSDEILMEENPNGKEKLLTTSNWKKTTTAFMMSMPLLREILCCEVIICEKRERREENKLHLGLATAIQNILSWFCTQENQDSCALKHYTMSNCKNPLLRNLLHNSEKYKYGT